MVSAPFGKEQEMPNDDMDRELAEVFQLLTLENKYAVIDFLASFSSAPEETSSGPASNGEQTP